MNVTASGPFHAIADLDRIFKKLSIHYLIGGSIASSLFGRFRTTNDIDCLIDVPPDIIGPFITELKRDFIVDEVALEKHLQQKKTYNIIHEPSFMKVDLFSAENEFHYEELERAVEVAPKESDVAFRVATAEDSILAKLLWLRKSGFTSERQQRDLEGIVAVACDSLDLGYLKRWGEALGVSQELETLLLSRSH